MISNYTTPKVNINSRTMWVLKISIFSAVTGVGIVVPLLATYYKKQGGTFLYVGLIFAAFSASRLFSLRYFGRLSDRRGRKTPLVAGLFLYGIVSIAFLCLKNINFVILIRFFQGIASAMLIPVAMAYVSDIAPVGKEGEFQGKLSGAQLYGLSFGPLLGGAVYDNYGIQAAFVCMGVLAFASSFLCLILLPATKNVDRPNSQQPTKPKLFFIGDKTVHGEYICQLAYYSCIAIVWAFLPVYLDEKFSLSSLLISMPIALITLVAGFVNSFCGRFADRKNSNWLLFVGGGIVSVALYSFQLASCFLHLIVSSLAFGLGGGLVVAVLNKIVTQRGKASQSSGEATATMAVFQSMGMIVGSVLVGAAKDTWQISFFVLGAVIMLLGVIGFFFYQPGTESKT